MILGYQLRIVLVAMAEAKWKRKRRRPGRPYGGE
jgi:hypothetical protein